MHLPTCDFPRFRRVLEASDLAPLGWVFEIATEGEWQRAEDLLSMVGGREEEIGRAISLAVKGKVKVAEGEVRRLSEGGAKVFVRGMLVKIGFELTKIAKLEEALTVIKLNASSFPEDFQAWNHLGKAYLLIGEAEEAIFSFERSCELNNKNSSAKEMIAKIRAEHGA